MVHKGFFFLLKTDWHRRTESKLCVLNTQRNLRRRKSWVTQLMDHRHGAPEALPSCYWQLQSCVPCLLTVTLWGSGCQITPAQLQPPSPYDLSRPPGRIKNFQSYLTLGRSEHHMVEIIGENDSNPSKICKVFIVTLRTPARQVLGNALFKAAVLSSSWCVTLFYF